MKRQCRIKECTQEAVQGTFLCSEHLLEHPICEGIVREWSEDRRKVISERRCRNKALPGNSFCRHHGANSPKALAAAETARQLTLMEQFVQPYEGDFNPLGAFEEEWRRTMGRIHWLERQIAELDPDDFVWGRTKEERVNASEFAGTNTTYEAKVHIYEEMMWRERTHLLKIEGMWIKAGIENQKIEVLKIQADNLYNKTITALTRLGIDPRDDRVKDVLFEVFMEPETGPRGFLALPSPE